MTNQAWKDHPVAVIGGGPVGLAAAAHLVLRGIPVHLYERGATVAASVRDWGHVRTFSPWRFNVDAAARTLLERHGWSHPPREIMPSGDELYELYLKPLAEIPEMKAAIETNARVTAITRKGIDKVTSRDRAEKPFVLTITRDDGSLRRELARAVIDASGTWTHQNPLGAGGVPAEGERQHAERIAYGIPDVLKRERRDYAGKRVLVVGAGYSAGNVLLDLARLAEAEPATAITWAIRSATPVRVYGGGNDDGLPARGALGADVKALVDSGRVDLVAGFSINAVREEGAALAVEGDLAGGAVRLGPFDRIVVATGQRPDLDLTRELRLELDPWLESARALGPLIDPNLHSCGSVPPHGHRELAHPEPGFYTVGVKSYGRAPTFLLLTGHEQVRSVVAAIAGDVVAADKVELVLPETGVCTTRTAESGAEAGCCGGPVPERADACCRADAEAKDAGAEGCGCGCGTSAAKAIPERAPQKVPA